MTKSIYIAGGTGFIGRRLTEALADKGFEVIVITRSPPPVQNRLLSVAAYIDIGNLKDHLDSMPKLTESYIINLAGATIAPSRWSRKYKQEIYNSRIITTSRLTMITNNAKNPPKAFISASAVGYYGDCGDALLDEKSPPGKGFLAKVCRDWEAAAKPAEKSTRLIIFRIGIVLDSRQGLIPKLSAPFRLYLGATIGTGRQWMSWIHIDDLIGLFIWAIESKSANGIYNAVAPIPVRSYDLTEALGRSLNKPVLFRLPVTLIKLAFGEASEMLLSSQRVLPKSALDGGFQFQFDRIDLALKSVLMFG